MPEIQPWVAVVLVAAWMVAVTVELIALRRHVRKVDDLAAALHADLARAEDTLNKLTAPRPDQTRTMQAVRPLPAKPVPMPRSTGRHARAE